MQMSQAPITSRLVRKKAAGWYHIVVLCSRRALIQCGRADLDRCLPWFIPAAAPRGGIVVIQEIFGVNSHNREVTDGGGSSGLRSWGYDRAQLAKPTAGGMVSEPLAAEGEDRPASPRASMRRYERNPEDSVIFSCAKQKLAL